MLGFRLTTISTSEVLSKTQFLSEVNRMDVDCSRNVGSYGPPVIHGFGFIVGRALYLNWILEKGFDIERNKSSCCPFQNIYLTYVNKEQCVITMPNHPP